MATVATASSTARANSAAQTSELAARGPRAIATGTGAGSGSLGGSGPGAAAGCGVGGGAPAPRCAAGAPARGQAGSARRRAWPPGAAAATRSTTLSAGAGAGSGAGGGREGRHQGVGGLDEPALVFDAARAVAQVDLKAYGARRLEGVVEPIGDEALRPLAPAAAGQREHRPAQRLAGARERDADLLGVEARGVGGFFARTAHQRHQAERGGRGGVEAGEGGGHVPGRLPRVDRAGRPGGNWSQRRVLHSPAGYSRRGIRCPARRHGRLAKV